MITFTLADGTVAAYDDDKNAIAIGGIKPNIVSQETKSEALKIRIALGKKCNFKCAYCLQGAAKGSPEPRLPLDELCDELLRVVDKRSILMCSFWGGEPLLYLNEIKGITDKLSHKFAGNPSLINITTNGLLLASDDVWGWMESRLEQLLVVLSYDGPGQKNRGSDILANEKIRERVMRLLEKDRLSISGVITADNASVDDFHKSLAARLGSVEKTSLELFHLQVLDEKSAAVAPDEKKLEEMMHEMYMAAMSDASGGKLFQSLRFEAEEFLKCLDRPVVFGADCHCHALSKSTLAVDMMGNLLTCQNHSADMRDAVDGSAYTVTNLKALSPGVEIPLPKATATIRRRWETRCQKCRVRHLCRGGCLLNSEKWQPMNCTQLTYKYLTVMLLGISMLTRQQVTEIKIC